MYEEYDARINGLEIFRERLKISKTRFDLSNDDIKLFYEIIKIYKNSNLEKVIECINKIINTPSSLNIKIVCDAMNSIKDFFEHKSPAEQCEIHHDLFLVHEIIKQIRYLV